MKQKVINVFTEKKHFLVIFGFFCVRNSSWTTLETQKCQILHAKMFFCKIYIFAQKQV